MINLLLSDTNRSIQYLIHLKKKNISIKKIVIFGKTKKSKINKFLNQTSYEKVFFVKTKNINNKLVNQTFEVKNSDFNIISIYPGQIITNKALLKKRLLHCHPGKLPEFKGSTTIYYSLILKKKICVTLFQLNEKIDSGKILYKKYFIKPKRINDVEKDFDDKIRACTVAEYLSKIKNKKLNDNKRYRNKHSIPYFIAHPIIRQLVLGKKLLKNFFSA